MITPVPHPDHLDWDVLSLDSIELTAAQIEQAVCRSQAIQHPDRQWQVYLNHLALAGFQQWLGERAPDLTIHSDRTSLHQAIAAEWIDGVCQLQVGALTVCLLVSGALPDTLISLPRAVVEVPEFAAHLYVLVEVLEEQEQVRVYGSVRHDQLMAYLGTAMEPEQDWTYSIPLSLVDFEPDHVLLDLRLLSVEAIAIALPAPEPVAVEALRSKLATVRSKLAQNQPWQVLTWEEGRTVLTMPALQQLLTGDEAIAPASSESLTFQHATEPSAPLPTAANMFGDVMQKAVNVGSWLHDQLDEVAQEMAWVLMPAVATASAMRSAVEEFQAVTNQLRAAGLAIAPEARSAYRDLRWGNVALRLYAVAWPMPFDPLEPNTPPEWSLLLILGPQPHAPMPLGIRLRVQDSLQTLVERARTQDSQEAYLYARVIGLWDEPFWVTIDLGNGVVVTLPPFSFNPDTVE